MVFSSCAGKRRKILRSYALFRLRKRKIGSFGRFRSGDPFLCCIADAAKRRTIFVYQLEVRIQIQIHVSIKFTPGIDPYVLFAKPISIAKFLFLQPIRMEHFAIFLVYDWVGKIWPLALGGQFGRLVGICPPS